MNELEFCRWLQGFFEIAGDGVNQLDERQTATIREHLQLVFAKVTGQTEAPVNPVTLEPGAAAGLAELLRKMRGAGPPPISLCSGGQRFC